MPAKSVSVLDPTGGPQQITITPELATQLLERNGLNRPLSDAHVTRIANQIRDGKWRFNGDTIKLSADEDILDGQHRLWAIIESKKSVDTIIVYGIKRDAFSTIDTIRKPRSGGDVIALAGAQRHRQYIAAALSWMIRWQRGVLPKYRDPSNKVENSHIEEAFKNHPAIQQAVDRCMRLRPIVNPGILGFLYYILTNRNPDVADRMLHTLENPGGVSLNDPFFRLRLYFTADHHKAKDPVVTIALTIKAANAAFCKQDIKLLSFRTQGDSAEAFPTLSIKRKLVEAA